MKNKIFTGLFILLGTFLIFGCGSTPKDTLVNKIFINKDDGQKQIVGFTEDSIFFKWDDTLGVESHKSAYNINPVNDSVYNIEVKDKTPYMETNTWQIIMAKDGISFTSADSKKRYVISQGK